MSHGKQVPFMMPLLTHMGDGGTEPVSANC